MALKEEIIKIIAVNLFIIKEVTGTAIITVAAEIVNTTDNKETLIIVEVTEVEVEVGTIITMKDVIIIKIEMIRIIRVVITMIKNSKQIKN